MPESINVLTGLPRFHTATAGTHFLCLLLLPFSIKQLHNSATLEPHQPPPLPHLDKTLVNKYSLPIRRLTFDSNEVLPYYQHSRRYAIQSQAIPTLMSVHGHQFQSC